MRVTSALAVAGLYANAAFAGLVPLEKRAQLNDALSGAKAQGNTPAAPAASTPSAAPAPVSAQSKPVTAASTSSSGGAAAAASKLTGLGFKSAAQNSNSNNGQCWIGSDGPNTNVVTNGAGVPITVVVWGANGSWMTGATPPLIAWDLAPGASTTISCGDISGGMAAIYPDTTLTPFGQIGATWAEFTYGPWGTVDISREVFMGGKPMSVKGDKCTADMSQCVFTCKNGASTCYEAGTYQLDNCGPQNGGQSDGAGMNGGCLMGPGAKLQTTFS